MNGFGLDHLPYGVFSVAGGPRRPNWRHLPIGYHGRAGTVVVSGTDVRRPRGLRPSYGPTERLDLEAELAVDGSVVSRPPYAATYWSPAQMLAHLTVNGASLRTGDLFASGTISGPEEDQRGSFLELWWNERFLDDGDEVVLRASAPGTGGGRITLGEVAGRVVPAR